MKKCNCKNYQDNMERVKFGVGLVRSSGYLTGDFVTVPMFSFCPWCGTQLSEESKDICDDCDPLDNQKCSNCVGS